MVCMQQRLLQSKISLQKFNNVMMQHNSERLCNDNNKQARNYGLNPNLQFCSDHANPPHSFLHTMVVTASAQMRVDVI